MNQRLPQTDIVLVGIGHTHAHIVRQWRMKPLPGVRLTCVSNSPWASYSGMMPGVLAGQYPRKQMLIDLVRLCASAGARLILGETCGIDREKQILELSNHPPVRYDILSIGIGSTPSTDGVRLSGEMVLPIKPMQTFPQRLRSFLNGSNGSVPVGDRPFRICVVGGGVGGVEIVNCLPETVARIRGPGPVAMTLVHAERQVALGLGERARRRLMRHFATTGVRLELGRRVTEVRAGEVVLDDGRVHETDMVIWATGAAAPGLLGRLDVKRNAAGFLETTETLQSVSDPRIFAVGDSGSIVGRSLPKAGVFAVRQGPILWHNLRASVQKRSLRPYRPQSDFLRLVNTGDGRAVADYHGLSVHSRWAWHWKDRIDRRFMAMYQRYEPPAMMSEPARTPVQRPRCAGCGSKLGGSILRRVLSRLVIPSHPSVLCGLDEPDDAALIESVPGEPLSLTVDFFTAPVDDPYLFGRIAALHAAGDCHAFGGQPVGALAMVVIPEGDASQQERMLEDFLRGGLEELRGMGATLLGGHTMEGTQLMGGFSMVARHVQARSFRKSQLRPGDRLILTKPLGTGILLAAHMQAACRAEWWGPLLETMLRGNRPAAECAEQCGVLALTDITGFGLAGHLLEMLQASHVAARIDPSRIALLPGVDRLLQEGWESTLAPANRQVESRLWVENALRSTPAYQALFDPQTSGGLLMGVPAEQQRTFPSMYRALLGEEPVWIGEVLDESPGEPRLAITSNLSP